jgi:hypothetical protein
MKKICTVISENNWITLDFQEFKIKLSEIQADDLIYALQLAQSSYLDYDEYEVFDRSTKDEEK